RRAHLDLVNDSFTTRAGIRGLDRADCRFLRFERESLLDAIGVGEESHIGPIKSAGDSCAPLDRNAPPAMNSDKEAADAVAARQRKVGGKVSAILRELYPSGSRHRSTESTHAAFRKALNYYYDKEGAAKK